MGINKVKVTGFRIEDESILEKLSIIAKNNCRTRNKEVEYALKQYVDNYERENGTIDVYRRSLNVRDNRQNIRVASVEIISNDEIKYPEITTNMLKKR